MKTKLLMLLSFLFVPLLIIGGSFISISGVDALGGLTKPNSKYSFDNVSSGTNTTSEQGEKFAYDRVKLYGPYTSDAGSIDFDVSFHYNGSLTLPGLTYRLIQHNYQKNGAIYKYSYDKGAIQSERQKDFNMTYLLEDINSNVKSVYICYGLYNYDLDFFYTSISFTFNILKTVTVSPLLYTNEYYQQENTMFYANGEMKEEKFLFDRFTNQLYADRYNRVQLSELSFKYISDFPLTYENAYIFFEDPYKLFPHVNTNDLGYRVVPIRLLQEGNKVTLLFASGMGVDPLSLQMYVPNVGQINSKSFYFPKNTNHLLESYKYNIFIRNIGKTHINFQLKCYISLDSYVFGDCNESDYCVIGGIKL